MKDNHQRVVSAPGIIEDLTFGLDIGIASVGWAVLTSSRIVDVGVRAFDKAETPDTGESLNLQRRSARLSRRRLWRRAWRLTKLARVLKRHGLIEDADFFRSQPSFAESTWRLRVAALDRKLTPTEFARVLYHLCKHRGFHWASRAEERNADDSGKSEGGRVKAGLATTGALMQEKHYRTAAEMVLAEFPEAQRNKRGDYSKALSRLLLDDELRQIFKAQRDLGNGLAAPQLETEVLGTGDRRSGLFWSQKPALAGRDLLKMLGHCTFERGEYRAPKASFTAERHVWLTRLNQLRVIVSGVSRPLTREERDFALLLPYQAGERFTYRMLRTALVKAGRLPESFRFGGLAYPSDQQREEERAKDPEEQVLTKLAGWHGLRLTLRRSGLEPQWQQISVEALEGRPETLDSIAWTLSVFKDDDEVCAELARLALPEKDRLIDALLGIRFDKFHALSLKALRRIVPLMEQGMRYDEAVASIEEYGHHSQRFVAGAGMWKFLPPFYSGRDAHGSMRFRDGVEIPRNPVVLRALNQARKVVNALVKAYGSPSAVHIEMARDLSRPLDERRDIEKLQHEYRERNEHAREQFRGDFGRRPSGAEFEKWLLYREQHGKCAYSLIALDLERVVNDPSYTQVDHALPYSRSYDDSKNNKVLTLTKVNQDKGNRTPYEFLEGALDSDRWRSFATWVETNKSYRQAKRNRLLRKNYGRDEAESFKARNLNDTRHICKFFKAYVEEHLQLAEGSENKRCVVVSGQLTAFLRARWGLLKSREESDRHHALDAAVVAACSHGMVKLLADYARSRELEHLREGFPDPESGEFISPAAHQKLVQHFPEPWAHFRQELLVRIRSDDAALLREEVSRFGTYPADVLESLRPLFVSRAPQRRNGGPAHKATVYAQPKRLAKQGGVAEKVPLASLTLKDLERLADPHRNERLYGAIRERLEAHGGKGDKAFPADRTLRKPDKEGRETGPAVRTVTLIRDRMTGVRVRGGLASNDTMLRVDVFTKAGRFHLVPVYVHHRVTGLPNRAIVQKKDEADWTLIDDTFEFAFSMYPNDLVRIEQRNAPVILGYFRSCHSRAEVVSIALHDRNKLGPRTASLAAYEKDPAKAIPNDKLGLIENLGVKTALRFEKLHVSILGHLYPAPRETRRGLA